MRFIRKVASIVSSFIIILAIGGFVFVRNFDLNRYKPEIENLVAKATGRVLQIHGDAKLGLSLIPTVVIQDVTFSNPEWAKNPYMAKLRKLEIKFAIMPLLKKQVEISKLVLQQPEVYLETSVDGQKSWVFSEAKQMNIGAEEKPINIKLQDASAALGIGLVAEDVELENGIIVYYNGRKNAETRVVVNSVEMDAPAGNEPFTMDLSALYDGQKINAEIEATSLDSLLNQGKANFTVSLDMLNIKADIRGAVEDVFDVIRYAVEANVYNPAGNFNLPKADAVLRIDGDITSADIMVNNLSIVGEHIQGKVNADWSGKRPMVTVDLNAPIFNINDIIKASEKTAFVFPSLIKNAEALTMVSDNKIPYEYLNLVDAVLLLKAGKVFWDDLVLADVLLKAELKNGVLNVTKFDAGIGGGKVIAKGMVDAGAQAVKFDITSEGLKLQEVYVPLATGQGDGMQILSGGNLDVRAVVSASGSTYRKLSDNLTGQLIFIVGKSEIKIGQMKWLTGGVVGQLLDLLKIDVKKTREDDLNCAVLRSDLGNGKAFFPSGLVIDSSKLKLVSSGSINLVNDEIDFTVAPMMNKLADGNITQALASFVKVVGKVQEPKIRLDKSSALTTIVGTFATGGIYLGSEVALGGSDSPCYTALEGTEFAARFPKPKGVKATTKNVYQDVTKQTKNAVKDIGNAAKDLLNMFTSDIK